MASSTIIHEFLKGSPIKRPNTFEPHQVQIVWVIFLPINFQDIAGTQNSKKSQEAGLFSLYSWGEAK